MTSADWQVLVNGARVGRLDRNGSPSLPLAAAALQEGPSAVLDIVVEAVGRSNEGWKWDPKGLPSPHVFLNGTATNTI